MKKTLAWNLQEKKGRYTISHSKGQTLVHFEWSAVRELDGADPGLIQTQIIAKKLVSGKAIQICDGCVGQDWRLGCGTH